MEDLIKRSDAISKTFCASIDGVPRMVVLLDDIKAIPSADRPQGVWKAKSFHEYICDNCGFSFDMMKCDFLENMKYCPNCGVRKGADDEDRR